MESRGIGASSSASLPGRAGASWSLAGGPSEGLIRPRPRVGALAAVVLAVLFAGLVAPVVMADRLLGASLTAGEPAPYTARAPMFFGIEGATSGGLIAARGQVATPGDVDMAAAVGARIPAGPGAWALYGGALLAAALVLCLGARRGYRGRWVRAQLVVLGALVLAAAAAKAALLLSPVSVFAIPIGAIGLAAAVAVDARTGVLAAIAAALVLALLVPLDSGVALVLAAQTIPAALVIAARPGGVGRLAVAGAVAAIAAAGAFAGVAALAWSTPAITHPGLIAAAIGGAASAPVALVLAPLLSRLAGEPGRRALADLQAFANPLLQQIADRAPGTWVHTLVVARLAEAATEAIGGDSALARTGAYYHDLGKSLQPKYFDENLGSGEPSPRDGLAPEIMVDVIAAHVTEGVRAGRSAGLPARVIDFMHMHHAQQPIGDCWDRYVAAGRPGGLFEDHFHYPGELPQSRETAVLAICDGVENEWRRSDDAVATLVRRVVYDRLHEGQLDDSGLTVGDLRVICEALEAALAAEERPRPAVAPTTSERREASTRAIRKSVPEPVVIEPDPEPAPRPVRAGRSSPVQRPPTPAPPAPSEPELVSKIVDKASTALGHASGLDDNAADPVTVSIRRTRSGVAIPEPPPAREVPGDLDVTNPLNPAPPPPSARRQRARPGLRTEQLSEWEEALSVVEPGASGSRHPPSTIELLGGDGAPDLDALEPASLSPGTLVIGPPPETHPRARAPGDLTPQGVPIRSASGPTTDLTPQGVPTRSASGPTTDLTPQGVPTRSASGPTTDLTPQGVPTRSASGPTTDLTVERDIPVPGEAFPDDTEPSVVAISPALRDDKSD